MIQRNVSSWFICFIYSAIPLKRFICRNLAVQFTRRLIANRLPVTRRPGHDRKNVTERFTEFRGRAENGKLIILSRKKGIERTQPACLYAQRFPISRVFDPFSRSFPSERLTPDLFRFSRSYLVGPYMLCNIKSRFPSRFMPSGKAISAGFKSRFRPQVQSEKANE